MNLYNFAANHGVKILLYTIGKAQRDDPTQPPSAHDCRDVGQQGDGNIIEKKKYLAIRQFLQAKLSG